ncbi:hypothetical protein H0H92_014352 [Tricholoma furcatifolium]|nr:hypothetical protein H0H92_014352 [Tricholoma furcatifolium]
MTGATDVDPDHASHELLRHADFNPLGYTPSNVLTAIALVLILLVAFSQTFCMRKWGPKWMLSLVIGEYCFAVGFILRFVVRADPDSIAIYAVENMFIILSPCAFIAADYVLLGRLARHLGAEKHLLVPAHKITKYFVISDVVTFIVQASGGGLSASANSAVLGSRIFLVGLILKLVSFTFFIVVYATFLIRVRTKETRIWTQD